MSHGGYKGARAADVMQAADCEKVAQDIVRDVMQPDGTPKLDELRAVLNDENRQLALTALKYLPSKVLEGIVTVGKPPPWQGELRIPSDVLHSAEILRDGRQRQAWLERALPEASAPSAAPSVTLQLTRQLPPELRCAIPFFSGPGRIPPLRWVQEEALDEEERRHANVPSSESPGKRRVVTNLRNYETVLATFCGGFDKPVGPELFAGLPWAGTATAEGSDIAGCVIAGGACLAALLQSASHYEGDEAFGDSPEVLQLLRSGRLYEALQKGPLKGLPGSARAAKLIVEFTGLFEVALRGKSGFRGAGLASMFRDFDKGRWSRGDIDVYVIANSKAAGARVLDKVANHFQSVFGPLAAVRTMNSVTLCPHWPRRHVQLITRVQESVDEILAFADLDCTAMCYDGRQLWVAPRTLRALRLRHNLVPSLMLSNRVDTPARIAKYALRGFGSLIFNFDTSVDRSDVNLTPEDATKLMMAKRDLTCKRFDKDFVHPFEILERIKANRLKLAVSSGDSASEELEEGSGPFSPQEVAKFLAKDTGYDEVKLPRGPGIGARTVAAFVEELQESAARPLRINFVPMPDIPAMLSSQVEWRRERKPEAWADWGMIMSAET